MPRAAWSMLLAWWLFLDVGTGAYKVPLAGASGAYALGAVLLTGLTAAAAEGGASPSPSPSPSPRRTPTPTLTRTPTPTQSSTPAPTPLRLAEWEGTHGTGARHNTLRRPGPQAAPALLGATGARGKSHGAVAVDADDNVVFVAWNATGPFLYSWRPSGELAAVAAGPSAVADATSISIDALVLGFGVAVVHLSYQNASCDPGRCSGTAAFRLPSLEPAWSHFPTGLLSSSAMSPRVGGLVTLSSLERTVRVLNPSTGEPSGAAVSWREGGCDAGAGLAIGDIDGATSGGGVAFVSCADGTLGESRLVAVNLVTRRVVYITEKPVSYLISWPPPIAFWRAPQPLVVAVSPRGGTQVITAVHAGNGTRAWTAILPYPECRFVLDFALAGPLIFLLYQSYDPAETVFLLAYNATGQRVAAPFPLPLRVDQFQGSLLADPDGATVFVNGWDAGSLPKPGALKVIAARLGTGADGARAWAVHWTAAPAAAAADAGRFTITGAQRRDGSLVFSGSEGVFRYG